MKITFLFLLVAVSSSICAQQAPAGKTPSWKDSFKKMFPAESNSKWLQVPITPLAKTPPNFIGLVPGVRQGQQLAVLENGNRLIALPQDGMLCVVPDMRQFNMPNAVKTQSMVDPMAGRIPNPSQK